jgi:mRNA interferase RelE/StbE
LKRSLRQWVARVFPHIEALADNPRPVGSRKLQGEKNLWRIRVGEYRVIYSVDDRRRLIDITAVRHRSEAYR